MHGAGSPGIRTDIILNLRDIGRIGHITRKANGIAPIVLFKSAGYRISGKEQKWKKF